MKKTILIIGTLDTKGAEHAFICDLIEARGHACNHEQPVVLVGTNQLAPHGLHCGYQLVEPAA